MCIFSSLLFALSSVFCLTNSQAQNRIPIPYSLTVKGQIQCEKRPGVWKVTGTKIDLYDEDTIFDSHMGSTVVTDQAGYFEVSGWAVEEPLAGPIDPYLDIVYTCGQVARPCILRFVVGGKDVLPFQTIDVGTISLTMRDCKKN
uniref:Uncharacterized protein n=1 Tax=Ditylenchus dipsaci TaxID=166011 RepID=A0A915D764_9BILA